MGKPRRPQRIDCIIFHNEFDLLQLRLETLGDAIDHVVLVEGNMTFAGKPKPYSFQERRDDFVLWSDMITHVPVDLRLVGAHAERSKAPWLRERAQRNAILDGLRRLPIQDHDIIFISDADELFRPDVPVPPWHQRHMVYAYQQDVYYYDLNTFAHEQWYGTRAVRAHFLRYANPDQMRYVGKFIQYPHTAMVNGAGWHFTHFGGADALRHKIESFSHQELNRPEIVDPAHLTTAIETQVDVFGRELTLQYRPLGMHLPLPIVAAPERWSTHMRREAPQEVADVAL